MTHIKAYKDKLDLLHFYLGLIKSFLLTENIQHADGIGAADFVGRRALDLLPIVRGIGDEGEGVPPHPEVLRGEGFAVKPEPNLWRGMAAPGLTGDKDPVLVFDLAHHVAPDDELEAGLAGEDITLRHRAGPLQSSAGHGVPALHLGPRVTPVLEHRPVHQGLPLPVGDIQHPGLVASVL